MNALVYDVKPLNYLTAKLLRPVWRRVLTSRLAGLALKDIPEPELPADDWVKVRTRLAGICGTDTAILAQQPPIDSILQAYSSTPVLLGHENVAEVVEVGPAVDAGWIGRRVCVEPTLGCVARGIDPMCDCCQRGEFGACENFAADGAGNAQLPPGTSIGYNARTGGAYGEMFVAHESQLVPVPEGLADEEAIITDPFACSLHAVLRMDLSAAERVLVYGAGMIGLGVVASLRAVGYEGQIDVLGIGEVNHQWAMQLGATNWLELPFPKGSRLSQSKTIAKRSQCIAEHLGVDCVLARFNNPMLVGGYNITFDCLGMTLSTNECLKWTAARGQVGLVATGSGRDVDMTPIWFRELTLYGAYGRQRESFAGRQAGTYNLVHEFMCDGRMKVKGLLTHTFAIKDYRDAFDVALRKGRYKALKVALDFRNETARG